MSCVLCGQLLGDDRAGLVVCWGCEALDPNGAKLRRAEALGRAIVEWDRLRAAVVATDEEGLVADLRENAR